MDKAASDPAALEVDTVLKYWDKLDVKTVASLKKVGTSTSTAVEYLRFNSLGMLARKGGNDTDVRAFEVYVKGCKGDAGRKITIGLAGLINTSKIACP